MKKKAWTIIGIVSTIFFVIFIVFLLIPILTHNYFIYSGIAGDEPLFIHEKVSALYITLDKGNPIALITILLSALGIISSFASLTNLSDKPKQIFRITMISTLATCLTLFILSYYFASRLLAVVY